MSDYRCINVTDVGDVTVVRFGRDKMLEDTWIREMGQELLRLYDESASGKGSVRILITFENVTFISSTAVGALQTFLKRVNQSSGKLVLCSMSGPVYNVFAITKLNRLFTIVDTETQALDVFAAVA